MNTTRSLHQAAEDGDLAAAERLLQADPYLVGSREDYKLTPLHRAAVAGHADVIAALLARSAHVDARDHGGGTALHGAAAHGRAEAAAVLLDGGADANAVDEDGHTPLHFAARGDLGVVQTLLAGGGLANARSGGSHKPFTPWHAARQAGHGAVAALLRDHGGPDKAAQAVSIHRAAEHGYLGRLQVLVKEDPALVASRDYLYRRTPLHWAADHGHKAAAELLLAQGADVGARDKAGDTPLDRAEAMGHADIAELLRR